MLIPLRLNVCVSSSRSRHRAPSAKQIAAASGISEDWRRGRQHGPHTEPLDTPEYRREQRERHAAQQIVEAVAGFDDIGVMTSKPGHGKRNRRQVSITFTLRGIFNALTHIYFSDDPG